MWARESNGGALIVATVAVLAIGGCDRVETGEPEWEDLPPLESVEEPMVSTESRNADPEPDASHDAPTEAAEPVNLTLPPVATFDRACARCHGPEGSFYGRGFASHPDELRQVIDEMMRGPAFLDPTESDVEAMTAYHRALAADEPFVAVTNAADAVAGEPIEFDASPDADVTVARDNGTATLTVARDDASVTIHFPRQLWSHGEPGASSDASEAP